MTAKEKAIPSVALLREWANSADNTMCWGLDAAADELERLRCDVALRAELEKAMADCIGVKAGQTFEERAEELMVMEVGHENIERDIAYDACYSAHEPNSRHCEKCSQLLAALEGIVKLEGKPLVIAQDIARGAIAAHVAAQGCAEPGAESPMSGKRPEPSCECTSASAIACDGAIGKLRAHCECQCHAGRSAAYCSGCTETFSVCPEYKRWQGLQYEEGAPKHYSSCSAAKRGTD